MPDYIPLPLTLSATREEGAALTAHTFSLKQKRDALNAQIEAAERRQQALREHFRKLYQAERDDA